MRSWVWRLLIIYIYKDLGDRLLPCFDSLSDINLQSSKVHAPRWDPDSSTSEVSTIQLEFRDLSRATIYMSKCPEVLSWTEYAKKMPRTGEVVAEERLAGDYESLVAGNAKDALVDMTGGSGERIAMEEYTGPDEKKNLFRILRHSKENHSLMSASIAASANDMEDELSCGLVKGHAYSITAVKKMKLGTGLFSIFNRDSLQMIRCRNPWGGTEWNGAWSDGSPEWKKVSDSQKKDLGLTFDDNGEFWMSYEDFCQYFTSVDVCHMINMSMFSFKKTWREGKAIGDWRRPDRCGGCSNHKSFLNNPQADINRKYRMHDKMARVASGPFVLSRSVFNRVTVKRGRYLVIPSTFDPGFEGKYFLRLYCGSRLNLTELLYDEPQPGQCCGFMMKRGEIAATQITIVKADGLESQDISGADPYCVVKWDGGKLTNHHQSNTPSPEWDDRVTLYRKKPNQDIVIEVWDHNILIDELLGCATIDMKKPYEYQGGNKIKRYPLYAADRKKGLVKKPGGLWLKVLHVADMTTV